MLEIFSLSSTKTLLLLLALSRFSFEADAKCKRELLTSYGLQGLNEPSGGGLEMCPGIQNSCCKSSDQLDIYANWVHSKEIDYVKKHYAKTTEVYIRLLEELKSVKVLSKEVEVKLANRKISNCKVISQRIQVFEIEAIEEKIKENIWKMQEFFTETYKGFYCGVCNYDNHKFFNEKTATIVYSEKFCRDIIENTLPVQLFMKVNVVKYFNLISKFMVSCDHKGDYEANTPIPRNLLFLNDSAAGNNLTECRNSRNESNWFTYCKNICENFTLVSFSKYFDPNVKKIKAYTRFLRQQSGKIRHGGIGRGLLKNMISDRKVKKANNHKKERMLVTDPDQTSQSRDKSKEGIIFKSGLESKIDLRHFKSTFEVDGLSLYDDGRNSLISPAMYNSIKALIHVNNLKTSDATTVAETTGSGIAASMLSAGVEGVGLMDALTGIFLIVAFLN